MSGRTKKKKTTASTAKPVKGLVGTGTAPITSKQRRGRNKAPLEKTIQRSILKWLESEGYVHWRQNAGRIGGIVLGSPGLPDIIVVLAPHGHFLGLEVKRPVRPKLRPSQEDFKSRVKAVGGSYHMVTSLMDAKLAVSMAENKHGKDALH